MSSHSRTSGPSRSPKRGCPPPQELVNDVFMNDFKSIKAYSLACKALFVSIHHITHPKICLAWDESRELFTVPESRCTRRDRQGIGVRILSRIAAQGVLPYARHLSTHLSRSFTPANPQPFNGHFQRFDWVQELSVYQLITSPGTLEVSSILSVGFCISFGMSSEGSRDRRTWKSEPLSLRDRTAHIVDAYSSTLETISTTRKKFRKYRYIF